MACCELIAHDNHAHMVVTQQPNLNPNLHIIRNGQLLFTRRLSGLEGIAHLPLVALEDKQLDTFIQELQYSLDYYQNHLKQPPAVSIQLAIPNPEIDYLVKELSYSFAIEVSVFSSFLAICEQKSNEVQFAIAAALSIGVGEQNEITH